MTTLRPRITARDRIVYFVRRRMWTLVMVRTVMHPVRALRVAAKWRSDKAMLPLTRRHHLLDYVEIHHSAAEQLGRFPDLIAPSDFNDKIQWIKLFGQRPEVLRDVDKAAARTHVAACIGEQHLLPVRAIVRSRSEISPELLREPFVVKASHDSGSAIIVRTVTDENVRRALESVTQKLARRYGTVGSEWAYRFVRPHIIIESIIGSPGEAPADYRFYCVRGEAKIVQKHWGHQEGVAKEATFFPDGSPADLHIKPSNEYVHGEPVPADWGRMRSLAERLSAGYDFVRVDLFSTNEGIYFSELTFWPYSGYYAGDTRRLGELLAIDCTTFLPPVVGTAAVRGKRR